MIDKVRSNESGCVAAYIGLIRDASEGKSVLSVEYTDPTEEAPVRLYTLAEEAAQKWPINRVAITNRVGKLKVGEINLTIAINLFVPRRIQDSNFFVQSSPVRCS